MVIIEYRHTGIICTDPYFSLAVVGYAINRLIHQLTDNLLFPVYFAVPVSIKSVFDSYPHCAVSRFFDGKNIYVLYTTAKEKYGSVQIIPVCLYSIITMNWCTG